MRERKVLHFKAAERTFEPYTGFENAYASGAASIARMLTPDVSPRLGAGIARYRNVRTTWHLPFDEVVLVIQGKFTVRSRGVEYAAVAGDVLHFPRGCPVEYDITEEVTLFYAEHPATVTGQDTQGGATVSTRREGFAAS